MSLLENYKKKRIYSTMDNFYTSPLIYNLKALDKSVQVLVVQPDLERDYQ